LEKFSRATQPAADTSGFTDEYSNSKLKIYTLIDVLATVDWLTTKEKHGKCVSAYNRLVGSAATARYSCYADQTPADASLRYVKL
jgi:hypothetical protein